MAPTPDRGLDFRALFDAFLTPCLVLSPSFVILAANPAHLAATQRTRESVEGRVVFEAYPDNPHAAASQSAQKLQQSLERVRTQHVAHAMDVLRYDVPLGTPPDVRFDERYWAPVNVPVLDSGGALAYILHWAEDVTHFVKAQADQASTITAQAGQIEVAQARLQASQLHALAAAREAQAERSRLNAVLEAAPVGIFVTDSEGRLVISNLANEALWGPGQTRVGDPVDFPAWKGWWLEASGRGHPVQPDEWPMARALKGEHIVGEAIEMQSFHRPPVVRTILASAAPVTNDAGALLGGVTAVMDITDRTQAEQALRDSDRRKDDFLAMLAHELRNPLAPIRAAADLLALGRLEGERMQQTSAVIARQVRHLTVMVDDLLDVSRVTRGLITLETEALEARPLLQEAIEQVRPLLEAKQQRLVLKAPTEPIRLMGDPDRLVQVMANVLNNAVKYTPTQGQIEVTLARHDDEIELIVTDTGIGMTPELVQRAFDLFAQGERTSDRSQGGLGIGLALVKSLVQLHGGTVQAESDGPGRGSRFIVRLPALSQPSVADTGAPASVQTGATGDALTVMVVDDNVDAAQMLAMLVETLGHHPIVEHSSSDALARAAQQPPDVCLLDIGLPEVDGYELARRLRAQAGTRPLTLVAVTGYGQEQDKIRTRQAGFDHHLVKPADSALLAQLLDHLAVKTAA